MCLPWRESCFRYEGLPLGHLSEHIIHGLYLHRLPNLGPKAVRLCAEEVSRRKATYLFQPEIESCLMDRVRIDASQCVAIPHLGADQGGRFEISFFFQNPEYRDLLDPWAKDSAMPGQEFVVFSCQDRTFM